MDIKYLNTFKCILDTGSFQKAADRLNYAQSTVTLQIQLIEQELSVKLFDKIGRHMELTQAGRDLLPYVDTILTAACQLEQYSSSENEPSGTLRVAMAETLLTYQMQPVLKSFHELAPKVKLSLQALNCFDIREQVVSGAVDLGIHYEIGGYGSSAVIEPLDSYPLSLVASPRLNPRGRDFLTRGQRKDVCLLTVDKLGLYHRIFDDYLRKTEIVLNGELEICSTEAVKRSVASNLGIAYLPRFTVAEELNSGELTELKTGLTDVRMTAVCTRHKNKWLSPAMELFIRVLKECMPASQK